MKKIPFTKMAGAGNDFVLINAHRGIDGTALARRICDRTRGIGADGLLLLDKSKSADYRMRIINADGSEAEMCGNGARCMAAYIVRKRHQRAQKLFSMETQAGTILAEADGEIARVRLTDPKDYTEEVPLEISGRTIKAGFINTGVPHAVIFVDHLEQMDVAQIGRMVRHHQQFQPKGANVNFVEQKSPGLIHVRTYERGVEDETRACGTGSVASAIVAYLKSHPGIKNALNAKTKVLTASQEILEITFHLNQASICDVWLRGSAKFIAEGEFYWT